MCLAPCFQGCSDERYAEEAEQVRVYLESRGAWTLAQLEKERDEASAALDFEKADRLHQRMQKMKAVAQQAPPLVHPLVELDAIVVQPAVMQKAQQDSAGSTQADKPEKLSNRTMQTEADHVEIFLIRGGRILGPGFFSVEGMRHPNERAGSTSLFPHPTLLQPTPLEAPPVTNDPACNAGNPDVPAAAKGARGALEQRLQTVLDELEARAGAEKFPADQLSEHLALLARWYYRPANRRIGEIFFREEKSRNDSGGATAELRPFPLSRVLRGTSRVFCGQKETVETGERTT